MSDELQEGGTQPQGVETPLAAAAAVAPEQQAAEPEAKADAPKYDYVPAKFLKSDGTPDFEKMAKSYTNLEKLAAKKGTLIPEAAEEYQFDFGDMEVDQAAVDAFKAEALAAGFSKEQYAFMMDRYKANVASSQWSADRLETTLKADWGTDYDTNVAVAQRAFEEFAPSDASPHDPVWNHPAVMKMLARMGAELGEDSIAGKSGGAMAPAMTEAEVVALMKSSEYRDGNRDMHSKVSAWYAKNR